MDYAVLRTGGKQYRVKAGDVIDVDRLAVEPGSQLELGDVLAVSRDGDVLFGRPVLEGARVVTRVEDQVRDDKVLVFKFKRKVRYRRKKGHRQPYTRLLIRGVLLEGEDASLLDGAGQEVSAPETAVETAAPAPRRRRVPRKRPAQDEVPAEDSGDAIEQKSQQEVVEKPAPRPRRRPSSRKPTSIDVEPKGEV